MESTAVPANPAAEVSPAAATPAQAAAGEQKQPKQPKEKKAKKGGDLAAGMAALELDPKPEYLSTRIDLFEQLKKEQDERIAGQSSSSAAPPFFRPSSTRYRAIEVCT